MRPSTTPIHGVLLKRQRKRPHGRWWQAIPLYLQSLLRFPPFCPAADFPVSVRGGFSPTRSIVPGRNAPGFATTEGAQSPRDGAKGERDGIPIARDANSFFRCFVSKSFAGDEDVCSDR